MNDLSEEYKERREFFRRRKENSLINSTELLRSEGIEFSSHNGGLHLKVKIGERIADFWPSTGKFLIPGKRSGRGVRNLIKLVREEQSK